jgi:peptide/nickel transport system substrate-binding protein
MKALAVVAAVGAALAGCYERGRARPSGDAGPVRADAAAKSPDAPAPPAHVHREPTGAPDPDATIRIALEAEPAGLEPLSHGDAIAQRIMMGDVFEGLVCPGPTLGDPPVPCLADRHAVEDGGRTWRFHLRAARWHDGEPVTSADVAATFRALLAQATWLLGEVDDLSAVETPAPDEVVLRFAELRADRLARLARVPILPTGALAKVDLARAGALAEAFGARPPPGTGPLRLVEWRRGDRIELVRWDGYWGTPAAAARIVYRVADRAQALRLLAAGELDVVVQVPVEEGEAFAADHAHVGSFPYRMPAYLAAIYNARRPALATPDARRALTALLDRPGLATRLFGGATITGPFPPADPGHDPDVVAVPFDRTLATRLLAGATPRVELLTPAGSPTMARVADIWASDARGVAELTVRSIPYAALLDRLATSDFDVALVSMTTGPELDLAPRLASTAPADTAWSGIADPELDRLLDAARDEPDPDRRAELRRALHRRIAALEPMAFIAPDVRLGLAAREIGGIADAREGAPPRASRLWRARP